MRDLRLPPMAGFARDRHGGVTIIVAFAAVMLIAFAAVAVDLASVFLQARKLQGVADLAAMAAARDIDEAATAAQSTAELSGWSGGVTTATTIGAWANDASVPAASRFTAGGTANNAVQVKATAKADLYFASAILGKQQISISRTATAAVAQMASFSLGTRLASIQGGAANALLSALTGSTVSLSVSDYNALANADIDLFGYMKAVQTRASLTGMTYDQTLSSNISTRDAIGAAADSLTSSGQTAAASAMSQLAVASSAVPAAPLNRVIDLGVYQDQDHVAGASSGTGVAMNAFELAQATLLAANGGRQLQLSVGGVVPGLSNVSAWLAVGQRPNNSPWVGIRQDGDSDVIRTAQTRLYIQAQGATVLTLLGSQPVTLPIYVETASAQAKLTSLSCPADVSDQGATMAVLPSVGQIAIASLDRNTLDDFSQEPMLSPANILSVSLGPLSASVTGYSDVKVGGGGAWQSVSFTHDEIESGAVKTVQTNDIASASVASLVGNLSLGVNVGGFGLNPSLIQTPVAQTLSSLAGPLDSLINSLTAVMGVHLGEADVRTNGLRCHDAALVA